MKIGLFTHAADQKTAKLKDIQIKASLKPPEENTSTIKNLEPYIDRFDVF
jgi:hypothetical protein